MITHKETVYAIEEIQPIDVEQELDCFYHFAQCSKQSHYDTDLVREYLDILKQEAQDNMSEEEYDELGY